ncbi:hypothetical protein KS4_26920 [Poriferisphaera corsica]|uniref:Uncharacterized protein n=1 Tax=Poriferisphaera corsica TaxID=2528020 RepID=A0A517YWL5_9BACT|nr:hypothetical protein KS4_26920 [Poriferisphaera corsica]
MVGEGTWTFGSGNQQEVRRSQDDKAAYNGLDVFMQCRFDGHRPTVGGDLLCAARSGTI